MNIISLFANILKSRFSSHTPLALTHLITSLCNCKCKTCDLWKQSGQYKNDLSKEEIFAMLEEAKKAGIISYTVWGGEPLLHQDLREILQFAKKLGFVISLITNGYLLKEQCNDITPFIDYLIVSLDSNDELHNEMRGLDDIRERAIEGIKLSISKTKVIINSVISNLNLDKIEDLLKLSKELNVSITFEPMEIHEGYNNEFRATEEELKEAFAKIVEFKKAGYSVGNSIEYLKNYSKQKKYVCHAPKLYINVNANGDIISCFGAFLHKKWGNVKEDKFKEIFNNQDFHLFCKKSEKCNKCDVSCVIESSLAYSLNPLYFLDKAKNLL